MPHLIAAAVGLAISALVLVRWRTDRGLATLGLIGFALPAWVGLEVLLVWPFPQALLVAPLAMLAAVVLGLLSTSVPEGWRQSRLTAKYGFRVDTDRGRSGFLRYIEGARQVTMTWEQLSGGPKTLVVWTGPLQRWETPGGQVATTAEDRARIIQNLRRWYADKVEIDLS
jgi:hypothetical protein